MAWQYPDDAHAVKALIGAGKVHALSLIQAGDDTGAQKVLDRLIADFSGDPDLPEPVFVIGEAYYNKAFQKENEGLDNEAKDQFRKAIGIWERIIRELPESATTACTYDFVADCYRCLGEYKKAIEHYQHILSNWPDYERAWNIPFLIRYCSKQLEKSLGNSK